MKHKISFALRYAGLLSLLLLGLYILLLAPKEERESLSENRMLRGFPTLSVSSVASGEFMDGFEAYLSDAFPFRSEASGLSQQALSLFGRAPERDLAQELSEQIASGAEPEPPAVTAPPAPTPVPEGEALPPEETAPPPETTPPPAGDIPSTAAWWFTRKDGERVVQETWDDAQLQGVADTLNAFRQCLPEDGRVIFAQNPVSSQGNSISDAHQYIGWGSSLGDALQPRVLEDVTVLNAQEILEPWLGTEDIYSTLDHHWLIRGSWREYVAIAETMGLPPLDYYEFSYKLLYEFQRDAYTPEQLQKMTVERQNLLVPQKTSPLESCLLSQISQRSPAPYMESNRFPGYGVYLGGRWPVWRLFETGYHTGRNALIIGDSFYHALLPFLTPWYDSIHSTDPRDDMYRADTVGASIRQMMEYYQIDDVYIITCSLTPLRDRLFQGKLLGYLNTDPREGWQP